MPARKTTISVRKSHSIQKSAKRKSQETKMPSTLHVAHMKQSNVTVSNVPYSYIKNSRMWVGVGVVVLAVFFYLYKGLFVAAMVNGQPITRLSVIGQLEKQNGKQALSNVIVQSLIMQEAQRRHLSFSQSDIDAQIKKIENSLKSQGVTLDDALSARGLTRKDLIDQIKLQGLLNRMVGTTIKVTDDDVQAYIDKNKDSLPKDVSGDDLKKQVRTQLEQQQLQEKTQSFVTDLQKKAKIQYFVSY